jgi:fibronectin-binding autotransporter adhesin
VLNARGIGATLLNHPAPGSTGSAMVAAMPAAPAVYQLADTGGNLTALGALATSLPDAMTQLGGWFRGAGNFASISGNAGVPGFSAQNGGFLIGLDRPVAENALLGVAAGYDHTNASENSSNSGTVDTGRVALYGGNITGPALVSGTLGYAYDGISTTRTIAGIGTAQESHPGQEINLGTQIGVPLPLNAATLTPRAGLQYLHLHESGFSETGASGFDLSSGARNTDSLQPFVGMALAQTFITASGGQLATEGRLAYSRETLSNSRALTVAAVDGTDFLVNGVKPSRDMLSTGIGLTFRVSGNVSLYANYDVVLPIGNTVYHTVSAGLKLTW